MPDESSPFRIEYEGALPEIVVALYFNCKSCGCETRFTEADEGSDGALACPCGVTISMSGERLSHAQAEFRKALHRITDALKR
jgi:hypothetical protein